MLTVLTLTRSSVSCDGEYEMTGDRWRAPLTHTAGSARVAAPDRELSFVLAVFLGISDDGN